MTELSTSPISFGYGNTDEIRQQLSDCFNANVNVEIRGKDHNQIRITDGSWRGADLIFDCEGEEPKLFHVDYFIPSFWAKAIIFLASIATFSIIMTIVLTAVVGEFTPGLFGVGGIAGFAMYSIVEKIFIANIKSSWQVELDKAIKHLEHSRDANI